MNPNIIFVCSNINLVYGYGRVFTDEKFDWTRDSYTYCAACFRHVTVSTRRVLFIDTRYSVANKLLLFVVHCHTSSYTYRIAFLTQQFIIISICQVVFHIIFSLFNLSFHFISFYTIDLN